MLPKFKSWLNHSFISRQNMGYMTHATVKMARSKTHG